MTDRLFMDSEDGERLFFRHGLLGKPYVLPNREMEERLYRRMLWINRISFLFSVTVTPALVIGFKGTIRNTPLYALIALTVLIGLGVLADRILIGRVVREGRRSASGFSRSEYMRHMADKMSVGFLIFGFVGSALFVLMALLLIRKNQDVVFGWLGGVFFLVCAILYGYLLNLKQRKGRTKAERSD